MLEVNKTFAVTVVLSVLIASTAFVLKKETNFSTEHNYNRCITIAMSESRQSGRVIEIEKAHEICKGLQK